MTGTPKRIPLLSVLLGSEQDIVTARQRARQIAEFATFDHQNQVRIATAVSEIARNAVQYAGGGRIDYSVELAAETPSLLIQVSDKGPGIASVSSILEGTYQSPTGMGLGIVGARRLTDGFELQSKPGQGTLVRLWKHLPPQSGLRFAAGARDLADKLARATPASAIEELNHNTTELVRALEELREREGELRRLNQELEETNRGVMALYAELEDRAVSLRRADELKSRFLSHISHEFRTPLNSIMALSRILQERIDGDLTAEQDKQIGYIRRAAGELTDMVNDLLDLAKVEAGKTDVQESEFSAAGLFGMLRGLMRPLQSNPEVELVFEEPPAGLVIRSDESKIAQILRNLISNALKFTERGEVRISIAHTPEHLSFTVSDTGIGIAPADQDRIFQEFTQVQHSLQQKVKGTGLGLALSRRLGELLGGSLTVESEPGRGSTFIFRLPSSVVSVPHKPFPFADEQPARLLVIDDDEVARYVIRQLLRDTGMHIAEADEGTAGLDRARFDRPDAILLDLSMPGLSGFEVLEQLRQAPETEDTPVIIYTSRSLSDADREQLAANRAVALSKNNLERADLLKALGTAAKMTTGASR